MTQQNQWEFVSLVQDLLKVHATNNFHLEKEVQNSSHIFKQNKIEFKAAEEWGNSKFD